jgi:hypothetical protein
MDRQLFIICCLTFIIHLIGTLAYSVRIAGIRTRKIALSFSMFNILILISRTSNSFQAPILGKRIEDNIAQHKGLLIDSMLMDFRWLLISATLATIIGALLIPTCQRFFTKAVMHFQNHRSFPKLLWHCFFKVEKSSIKEILCLPSSSNITHIKYGKGISTRVIILNILAVALWTIGVLASYYAGYLNPDLRLTSSSLSSIINGVSTIMMFVFIDPQLSMLTDDVVEGKMTEPEFRSSIVWLVGSRLAGTLLAQLLIVPAAQVIVFVAEWM